MNSENSNTSTKSKLSSKDLFDNDFLKEKDDALKSLEFLFDSSDIIEEESLPSNKKIKQKPKNKIKKTYTFNSNIVIIDSESVNSNEPNFNDLIEKEIEKINSLK